MIAAGASLLAPTSALAAKNRNPNILLIMADDLGAEVLPCYGNTVYSTPHLDRMASEGALFKNAFTSPVCSPTRAMILTGLHPNRSGVLERLDSPLDRREGNNRLPSHLKTFGHVFQSAGYATAIAGKWHLGDFQKYPDQPESHGFDEHCLWVQYWDGKRRSRYFGPHNWENGKFKMHGQEVFGPDYYCDFLIDFMERNRKRQFSRKFPTEIQRVALRKLRMLNRAMTLPDLKVPPGNRLEELKGRRKGQRSIRINDQWKVCFIWKENNSYEVEIVDYH
jgi:arylsulfatase A